MTNTAISIENVSKSYQLGTIGTGTFYGDMSRWWAKKRGKPDPFQKIGEVNHGNRQGGTLWALKDVNLQVRQGEALGIIGRNGAGKSTLLKILSRVTSPTNGEVKVKGRIASLLEVGTGFHPELTGRENIFLNGAIMGMGQREIQRKFDEIVDFSGVEQFIDTPVKRYSSGMYVRLAFAVAAHLEPEILVVDEVLAVGDAAFQRKCLGKISENTEGGRTVLFVSHNMAAINRICARAILLEKGQLVADGPTTAITGKYLSGADEESGMREWDIDSAPGTNEVRLLSVSLHDNKEISKSVFDVNDEVNIKLAYRVNVPDLSFRCAAVLNTQGVTAFSSVEPMETTRSAAGVYTSILKIPAHLLSENEYSINVSAFMSSGGKMHYFNLKNAIYFQVYDSLTNTSARGDYAQTMLGVVRPMLDWKTAANPVE